MNKIIVFCGEDIVSSRKAFLESIDSYKIKGFEIVKLGGKEIAEEKLELLSGPVSLFGEKRAIAIEGLLSGVKSKDKESAIEKIATMMECFIIVWEGKEFNKIEQAKYPQFIFKNFKLPPELFNFLDKIQPNQMKFNIDSFHYVSSLVDPAYIFLMLVRQVKYLILASENELSGMPSWQSGKFFKQAKYFDLPKLLLLYQKLLDIDFRQKTSQMPVDLIYELDLLFLEI